MILAFERWRQKVLKLKVSLDDTRRCSLKTTNKQIYGPKKLNKHLIF